MNLIKTKYKVNDVLKYKLDRTCLLTLHVMEVLTKTCSLGTETTYLCRLAALPIEKNPPLVNITLMELNEIEVELHPNYFGITYINKKEKKKNKGKKEKEKQR